MSITTLLLAFAVIAAGFIYYWRLAGTAADSLTFSNFFLGGGRVGAEPTHQTNWGLSLAFANAFWYFTYLSYTYGLYSFLFNVPWSLSLGYLAYSLMKYLRAAKFGTVHGFLGHSFGPRVRIAAAIATTVGYFFNCGFEIFYSALIVAQVIGLPHAGVLTGVVLAAFCGAYCMTGGYRANLLTDVPQNKLAVIAIVVLIAFLAYSVLASGTGLPLQQAVLGSKNPTGDFLIGILIFTSYFNLVDMANWQSIAANTNRDEDSFEPAELRALQWSFYRSAIKQMFAPSLVGALVGVFLRVHSTGLSDEQLYPAAFAVAFAGWNDILAGLVIGVVLLGFLSATLSSADNYLLASAQTLVNDVFFNRRYREITAIADRGERESLEEQFVRDLRRRLPAYAIAIVLGFSFLYYHIPGYVFAFQFIMYGTAICLFPALWFALKRLEEEPKAFLSSTRPKERAAFISIVAGVVSALVPFLLASAFIENDAVKNALAAASIPARVDFFQNLAPLLGFGVSYLAFKLISPQPSSK